MADYGYVWLYGFRSKFVSAGLGFGLGWLRPCLWRQLRWGDICGDCDAM